jgi:hypothetical protein
MALTSVWNSLKLDLRIALNVATKPDDRSPTLPRGGMVTLSARPHDQRRVFPSCLNHQIISLFWVVSVLLILFAIPHQYIASIVDSQVVHAVMNRIKDNKVFSLENNTQINPLSRKTVRRGK